VHAAILELPSRTARTQVIASEFLDQFLVTADDAHAALNLGFGWEPFTMLAGAFEKTGASCGLLMSFAIQPPWLNCAVNCPLARRQSRLGSVTRPSRIRMRIP
jgi:hypothetical protein